MRIKAVLTTAVLLLTALAVAQQSSQQPIGNPAPSGHPADTQPSAQQPMSTSRETPMTMSASGQNPVVKTFEQTAFKTTPGQPECFSSIVERGDPKTGPYVAFVKLASRCTIPLHWHSANEDLMFASGTGEFQAKGEQPQTMSQGAYVYMPSRHQHQLSCAGGCTFYVARDGPTDIHYVDVAGNELSPEAALAAVGERPAKSVATAQK